MADTAIMGPSHLTSSTKYEVQRQNNFEIYIYGIEGEDLVTLAVNQGPSVTSSNEEVTLMYGNRNVKVAGKVNFDSGTLNLKDFVIGDTALRILNWRKQVYDPETDKIGFAYDYKKECRIVEFAPDGSAQRAWRLIGAWPQQVNYGNHDYGSSESNAIEITLSYDLAIPDRS